MTDEQAVAKGHRAANEYAETNEAFDQVKAAILKTMVETSPAQPDKILKLHTAAQNLEAVRQALMGVIQSGQMAEHAIALAGLTRQ